MTIRPRNWKSFQHYNKRMPPWIKLHRELLDNYDYHRLPDASAALAPKLWLLASESADGSIDADPDKLAFRLRRTPAEIDAALKPLIAAKFFEVVQHASKALATGKQSALSEAEAETEGKTEREARARTVSDGCDVHSLLERVQSVYPPGTFANANWILAERAIGKLLDAGEDPAELVRAADAYRAQQDAKGSTGTQFVKSPEKFFGPDGHWRGPFPLPQKPEDRAAAARADSERIEWQNLEERAARVGFRKRHPSDDILGYRTLLERFESNQPRKSSGAPQSVAKLLAGQAR